LLSQIPDNTGIVPENLAWMELPDHGETVKHPVCGVFYINLIPAICWRSLATLGTTFCGISSFDTMINDIKIDPLERGTILIDINRLLLFEHPTNTELDHFFYHICSIGNNRTEFSSPSINNRVSILKAYLLKFYLPTKKITMIQSQSLNSMRTHLTESTLEDIDLLLYDVNFSCSLFIQGDIKNKLANKTFYNLLTS
jgi:hypothetical protein